MLENENYSIAKMHICSLEKKDNCFSLKLKEYPERLCVIDKVNKVVIDVETAHQYPYIKVLNNQYFLDMDIAEIKLLNSGERVGCISYATYSYGALDLKKLKRCKYIIELLNEGYTFPDGNKELTNEEYLEVVKNSKKMRKVKKMQIKRK